MRDLTERQMDVLRAVVRLTRKAGFPPTYRELRGELGINSNNALHDHLVALERKGRIRRAFGQRRGICVITPDVAEGQPCPVCSWPTAFYFHCLVCQARGCGKCCKCTCPEVAA